MAQSSQADAAPDAVIICQLFYPELISTGQVITELAEELVRMGMTIHVIAAQPTVVKGAARVDKVIDHKGVRIIRTWSTRLPKTKFIGKLLNLTTFFLSSTWLVLWKYRKSQLFLLTNPPYLPQLGWAMNVLRGQRYGVLLHDIMPEQAELIGFIKTNGLVAKFWRWLNHAWMKRADYAVVLTPDMLEGLLQNSNLLGTSEEAGARAKSQVIHIWADDRMIRGQPKTASTEAQRLGVLDKFVVQYSGNHGRFHDIETLAGIARSLRPEDGIVFQFIGEGQKKKLAEEAAAEGRFPIYTSSYVPKELLADSLAMADLGVVAQLPGQERVCYPSKLQGIMAAGRAALAICPPDCAMARMIRDNGLGFVVANGDVEGGRRALLEAAADPERVRQMGARAAAHLRANYTLEKAARAFQKVMNETAGRAG